MLLSSEPTLHGVNDLLLENYSCHFDRTVVVMIQYLLPVCILVLHDNTVEF